MTDDDGRAHTEEGLSRRGLLKLGGMMGIAVAVPAAGTVQAGPAFAAQSAHSAAAGAGSLSAEQTAVLEAFVERLIPEDATGPGAKEAGVASFIARSLEGGLAGGLSKLVPLYTAGLSAVDAYAKKTYGGAFTSLSSAKQDAVLTAMESGKATGFTPDSATFFATIREHTLEGMFSDPAYGGNRNYAGWNLIGFPGVRMPLPASDQKVGAHVKPAHASTYAGGQFPGAKKEAVA